MPDTTIAIAIMLGSFVILLMARMPISFTLGISSALTALYLNIPLATLLQRMVSGVQSFSLLAIPFFILAGEIMGQGGISRRLITLANAFVGWMRGGLAQVNILASMFFGGISGSAVADTSSIGSILIPMMTDSGYDKDFSVAVTVTSSCQGVMIPPSHNMILFAMAAGGGVSIGQLFMGGLIPGILLGAFMRFLCAFLTGVFFWGDGAGEQNVLVYSAVYNGTYLIPETIICMVIAMIPQIRRLARQLSLSK